MSVESSAEPAADIGRPRDWARPAIAALFGYFALRLIYLATALDAGVPPDETTHVGRILAFAEVWGFPASAPANHALGLLVDRPFLYNWGMARALDFKLFAFSGASDLVFLRLLNALLGLATVGYGLRWIRDITQDRLCHVVFVLLLTNTLMFTGICAAVSYDNLTNLAAAAAIYHGFRYLREQSPRALSMAIVFVGVGCLTKRSFLPLAALLTIVLCAVSARRPAALLADLGAAFAPRRPAGALALVLLLGNVALYGGNLLRYERLVPRFDQVVGREAAMQNRIFARDAILDGYRSGALPYARAMEMTDAIDHEADRQATRFQLARTRKNAGWRVGPLEYARLWSRIMLDRAVGYFGHQVIMRRPWELVAFGAVPILALALHVAGWRRKTSQHKDQQENQREGQRELQRATAIAAGLVLAYAAVLLGLVNYPNYLEQGLLDAGVQGRYLFPVLVPLLGFVAVALTQGAPPRLRWLFAAPVCALFLYGDLPSFLLRTTPAWFGGNG